MRAPSVAIAAGLAAIAVAVAIHLQDAGSTTRDALRVPVVDRGVVPSLTITAPGSTTPSGATARHVHHTVPAGSRLRLSRLHVDAPVVPVRVVAGVMQIPVDPHTLGWWRGGAGPGDAAGSVVVVGHINYAGTTGALSVLPDSRPGDAVTLGGRTYRVAAVRTYPKTTGIPMAAFSTDGAPRLVLITCGGPFDPSTGNYEDNIVVYASAA